jgi:hypothetical protein
VSMEVRGAIAFWFRELRLVAFPRFRRHIWLSADLNVDS